MLVRGPRAPRNRLTAAMHLRLDRAVITEHGPERLDAIPGPSRLCLQYWPEWRSDRQVSVLKWVAYRSINALAESFFSSLRVELLDRRA